MCRWCQLTLAESEKFEGVATVELVCVDRLLRKGGESIVIPMWRSVGGGFTGKG